MVLYSTPGEWGGVDFYLEYFRKWVSYKSSFRVLGALLWLNPTFIILDNKRAMEGMGGGWWGNVEVGEGRSVRVKCLSQEHCVLSLAWAGTQTDWSEHERTDHEGTAPSGWGEKDFVPSIHILSTKRLRCLASFVRTFAAYCSRICEIDACSIRWSTSIK